MTTGIKSMEGVPSLTFCFADHMSFSHVELTHKTFFKFQVLGHSQLLRVEGADTDSEVEPLSGVGSHSKGQTFLPHDNLLGMLQVELPLIQRLPNGWII